MQIRPARTAAERDAIYNLRHTVYAEQERLFPARRDRRVCDSFDEIPSTTHLIALDDEQVVGAARVTLPSPAGLPTDGTFDFASALPCRRHEVGSGGMLCVHHSHRSTPRPFWGLIGLAHLWLSSRGCSHMVGTFNPDVAKFFERVGARRLGADFTHPRLGVPVTPLVESTCLESPKSVR